MHIEYIVNFFVGFIYLYWGEVSVWNNILFWTPDVQYIESYLIFEYS